MGGGGSAAPSPPPSPFSLFSLAGPPRGMGQQGRRGERGRGEGRGLMSFGAQDYAGLPPTFRFLLQYLHPNASPPYITHHSTHHSTHCSYCWPSTTAGTHSVLPLSTGPVLHFQYFLSKHCTTGPVQKNTTPHLFVLAPLLWCCRKG